MRGKKASIKAVPKDKRYGSELITKYINRILLHGKRSVAEHLFYKVIESAAEELKTDPVTFVNTVTDNARPALEIRSRRVGGANYSVPVPVAPSRQETLAIRWIVGLVRGKTGASFDALLKQAMVDTFNNEGDVIKKKEDVERMAEANKAFAHFKW